MTSIALEFLPPTQMLTLNQREHWAPAAVKKKAWRSAAYFHARSNHVPLQAGRCVVSLSLPVADNRRRDGHNWVSTLKPVVDGLVDAGVFPDDSTPYVLTLEPSFHLRATNPNVILRIEPLEQP
jgi:crossover junction endodeoxyribonuclease RusA